MGRPRPIRPNRLAVLAVCALAAAVGCLGRRDFNRPPEAVLRSEWASADGQPPDFIDDKMVVDGLPGALTGAPAIGNAFGQAAPNGPPMNVLVLSGGGKFGAYTAGVLVGWTCHGTRPTFDVVTGVSSGALTALGAFLGPKYDPNLTRYYSSAKRTDIYRYRPIRGLIFDSAIVSSKPLEQLIAGEVTPAYMADLRKAHGEGRRLYIGTANIITKKLTVWDVGALACSGRPDAAELVTKVILAACTIPGLMPAVRFEVTVNGVKYDELHADGGSITQGFVRSPRPIPPGSDLWCLCAGKLYAHPFDGKPKFLQLVGATVSGSLYAIFRADMVRLFALCGVTGMRYHLHATPNELPVTPASMTFDPDEMRKLYQIGLSTGASGIPWRPYPAGVMPGEAEPARGGLNFVTK